jgi:hypothetical protein
MTQSAVAGWESGRIQPRERPRRLAEVLGGAPEQLGDRAEEQAGPRAVLELACSQSAE